MLSKVCIFLFTVLVSSVVSATLNGTLSSNRADNPYTDMNIQLTFAEAWRHCASKGLQLPTITSQNEFNNFLLAISSDMNGNWWLGGVDFGDQPGTFVWIHNAEPVQNPNGYTNWGKGEPNNAGGNER
ncbi:ladderlectin-like [Uranotaenia lowii]|uniref:ladderlectin-like n=1 Tax=Uranotaenia lowii TaxID=190385 RepID=UPI00247A74CB|nr:ladderlectin-like [Uranotaenia lowii]